MQDRRSLLIALGVVLPVAAFAFDAHAKSIRIGLVLPELSNEAIADIDKGARARAQELGNVEILTTGSYNGEEQAKAVENYIAAGVDVIAYDSIDAAAVGPAITKANQAGIPVIGIFSLGSSGKNTSFLTPDFRENGRINGRWMAKKLGPKGIVAHVEGNPADAAGADLTAGFLEGLAEGGIKGTVAQAPSNWDREKAMGIATDMLTAHPDLQGIYGANDDVAMGVVQAVKAAGRTNDVVVTGHNGTCEALGSVLKGDLDFTVMLFSKPIGALMVDTALKALNKEQVPEKIAGPSFGVDTAMANGILGGTVTDVPQNVAAEVKQRLEAAKGGCK